jgi:hypothetical protein
VNHNAPNKNARSKEWRGHSDEEIKERMLADRAVKLYIVTMMTRGALMTRNVARCLIAGSRAVHS